MEKQWELPFAVEGLGNGKEAGNLRIVRHSIGVTGGMNPC